MITYNVFYSLEEKRKIEELAEHKIIIGWVPYRMAQQMKAQQSVKCPACNGEGDICSYDEGFEIHEDCDVCVASGNVTVPEAEFWSKADLPNDQKLEVINTWRAKLSST